MMTKNYIGLLNEDW